jgi:hypothetical protein
MKLIIKSLLIVLYFFDIISNTILQNKFFNSLKSNKLLIQIQNKIIDDPNRCTNINASPINIIHGKNTVDSSK